MRHIAALFAGLLAACGGPTRETGPKTARDPHAAVREPSAPYPGDDAFRAALPFASIELEHEPYFMAASGPERYRVELASDGRARLFGRADGSDWGDFTGRIPLFEYGRLCEWIETANVTSLEDDYPAVGFHYGTYTLVLRDAEGRTVKRIRESGSTGPSALWAVHRSIEAVTRWIRWTPVASDDAGTRASPR